MDDNQRAWTQLSQELTTHPQMCECPGCPMGTVGADLIDGARKWERAAARMIDGLSETERRVLAERFRARRSG